MLASRVFDAAAAATGMAAMFLGERLGLYTSLWREGPASAGELARRLRLDERYVREWLEQQTAWGILVADGPAPDARYRLPDPHASVLADPDDPSYLASFVRLVVGMCTPLPRVLGAFRSGDGIPWSELGADVREGEAGANRNMYLHRLASEWLPGVPGLHERLSRPPGARVLDVGCGEGWAAIALARAYPLAEVTGIDVDDASILRASANAANEGLTDRVRFTKMDAARIPPGATYDLILAFEAIHDMPRPIESLKAMRGAAKPGAPLIVVELRVRDTLAALPDPVERFAYGMSLLCCLPAARAEPGSEGIGTVLRPPQLEAYARQAGFQRLAVLPIDHFLWRFYRLEV